MTDYPSYLSHEDVMLFIKELLLTGVNCSYAGDGKPVIDNTPSAVAAHGLIIIWSTPPIIYHYIDDVVDQPGWYNYAAFPKIFDQKRYGIVSEGSGTDGLPSSDSGSKNRS